eukprot:289788_1
MEPVVVICEFSVNANKIDEFIDAASDAVRYTNRDDEGCIFYNLHQDKRTETRFFMIEKWRSRGDLEKHAQAKHIDAFRQRSVAGNYFSGPKNLSILSDGIFNVTNNNIDKHSNNSICAVVFNDIKQDKVDQFIGASYPCIKGTNLENGCFSYNVYQDLNNKSTLVFLEKWESMKCIMSHMKQKHFRKFGGAVKYGGWSNGKMKNYSVTPPMVSIRSTSKL